MAMDDDMQTFRTKVRTNGDRIRAMNNAELAEFLAYDADAYCGKVPGGSCCFKTCLQCAIDWLKKEVEP